MRNSDTLGSQVRAGGIVPWLPNSANPSGVKGTLPHCYHKLILGLFLMAGHSLDRGHMLREHKRMAVRLRV